MYNNRNKTSLYRRVPTWVLEVTLLFLILIGFGVFFFSPEETWPRQLLISDPMAYTGLMVLWALSIVMSLFLLWDRSREDLRLKEGEIEVLKERLSAILEGFPGFSREQGESLGAEHLERMARILVDILNEIPEDKRDQIRNDANYFRRTFRAGINAREVLIFLRRVNQVTQSSRKLEKGFGLNDFLRQLHRLLDPMEPLLDGRLPFDEGAERHFESQVNVIDQILPHKGS